jgi:hypothetical protein
MPLGRVNQASTSAADVRLLVVAGRAIRRDDPQRRLAGAP